MQLKWEISSNGSNAILLERTPIRTLNLRGIALMKVKDVDRVRATFGIETVGFERYVNLWLDDGNIGTGVTVFWSSYPIEKKHTPLPDVCIRSTEWRNQNMAQETISLDDRRRYILNDLPLHCALRFHRGNEIGVEHLMKHTSSVLAGGTPFIRADRSEHLGRNIEFEFCDGELAYQYAFSPGVFSNVQLENVVQNWIDTVRSLQSKPDFPPDGGFQVSYRESLWERVARY